MKTHLNLLPFATQRSRQRSRWLRNALLLWGTTLICCVSYGHFQHAQLAEARAETAELELRCLPIRVATITVKVTTTNTIRNWPSRWRK